MPILKPAISIVLPANNEAEALPGVLAGLNAMFPEEEIIVVDDGSDDDRLRCRGPHQRHRARLRGAGLPAFLPRLRPRP
ncbi:MAG: glycosyltransferase, partial [Gammaproteobacteria bacterium]